MHNRRFGVVVRSTGERTERAVLDALNVDSHVEEVVVIRQQTPLYVAAAKTHEIFSQWVERYDYAFSIDADVIPFPGFGTWISEIINKAPYPSFSRWLPPLLDWVIQGRWRTAGGIFIYRTEHSAEIAQRTWELMDLIEPEHNYDIYKYLPGAEWRPTLEQSGEIVSIHQYAQDWSEYFYRGMVHRIRKKNWFRPGLHQLIASGDPEALVFMAGYDWATTNQDFLNFENAALRDTTRFRMELDNYLKRIGLPLTRDNCPSYIDLVSEITKSLPSGIKLIPYTK